MSRTTYRVEVSRGDRWWLIRVPEVPSGISQARNLRTVEATTRDLISLLLDVPEDSFDLDVHIELPKDVRGHLTRSAELRERAMQAQADAAAEVRVAARTLADQGVTVRDIGAALGVSFQRAQQLVTASASVAEPPRSRERGGSVPVAEVREWARQHGIAVSSGGKVGRSAVTGKTVAKAEPARSRGQR